ncbi:kinase-like domain-containing protein [Tribonema minus]|uniref:Mitogen-activated protein kinase n=1 Tax=Tribonema minus TaxID=303371 RepID=A0A836CP22_9STRA|nr:kinase-like domain-containing protein [Tribonema minus]
MPDLWEREYHKVAVGRETFQVDVRYKNLKPIGDGSYGFVCSADDAVENRQVAIKKIGDVFNDLVDAKRILREIKLLRHFDGHENIINITDIMCLPPNTTDFKDVYIVTNLMESDMDRIISSGQPLSDQHFQYFLYQVLRGLKFIHSANVLHRDMKPSNLLVNANCDLAICDFGLARGVELEYEDELTEYVVTRWYRAPELLCDSSHYGKTVDMWSVGCIFAEMLCRHAFFQGHNPTHQLETIVSVMGMPTEDELSFVTHPAARKAILSRGGSTPKPLESYFPADTNPLAIDLLRRMLSFHPEHRITVEEALEHAYLSELHGQMEEPSCDRSFDFEYERVFGSGDIPREELQKMMFDDMMQFAPDSRHSRAGSCDEPDGMHQSESKSYDDADDAAGNGYDEGEEKSSRRK